MEEQINPFNKDNHKNSEIGKRMDENIRNILKVYKNCKEIGKQTYKIREIFSVLLSKFFKLN